MIVRPVSKIGFALLLYFRFFNQSQCWDTATNLPDGRQVPKLHKAPPVPGTVVNLPTITANTRDGRNLSVLMTANYTIATGRITVQFDGNVTANAFQMVNISLSPYLVMGQMRTTNFRNSLSPSAITKPEKLIKQVIDFMRDRRSIGAHQ